MGFSVLRTVKRILFGGGGNTRKEGAYRQAGNKASGRNTTTTTAQEDVKNPNIDRRKIFTKEDGEYVDYEEVK